ncbi:hypothetical protein AAFF_G00091110 [Aldrovandia affinis]|uniref:Uncharacterized protein n=1 Tax=Aldrovandia affinis TaxID=143900 RepID=A0AAD7RW05_9TELE|nr:hypothetical protein AAFF_G00091110 [Aldrovandia affinis]
MIADKEQLNVSSAVCCLSRRRISALRLPCRGISIPDCQSCTAAISQLRICHWKSAWVSFMLGGLYLPALGVPITIHLPTPHSIKLCLCPMGDLN